MWNLTPGCRSFNAAFTPVREVAGAVAPGAPPPVGRRPPRDLTSGIAAGCLLAAGLWAMEKWRGRLRLTRDSN